MKHRYKEYWEEEFDNFLETEMERIKEEAIGRFASFISPSHLRQFALTVCESYFESEVYAEILANELDLSLLDFLAISENEKAFRMEYARQSELHWSPF
jgi:hypothetical protein